MSDRYGDRYDSDDYGYGDYDDYGSSRSGRRSNRDSRYGVDRHAGDYQDASRYSRSSRNYSSTAGADDRYGNAGGSTRRMSQSADAGYRRQSASTSGHSSGSGYDDYATARRRSGSSSGYGSSRGHSNYGDDYAYDEYADYGGRSSRRSARPSSANRAQSDAAASYDRQSYSRYSDRASSYDRQSPSRTADRSAYGDGSAQRGGRAADATAAGRAGRASHATAGDLQPKRANRKRNILIAVAIVAVVVLVGAGAAFAYVNSISSNLHEGVDEGVREALTPTSMGDAPFYMLLLGTDGSADRYADEEFGDVTRSDSMMLARVDPVNKKVALISIHRDTMVDLGQYGEQKINAAYETGGAAGAIEAVSKMAGVDISHYASVDFDGFQAIVNALGGIEVEVPMEIDDELAGGHLEAGYQTLDGWDALVLCRARHAYDDVANDGDVMRAANQRMVIGAIAKKVLSSDVLTIANTVQAMSQYVTTDLSITDIIGLAQIMQGIDPAADIYTAMEPTNSEYIDETWYEFLDETAWKKMIQRMDQGLPPVENNEIDDATGTVLSTAGTGAPTV